MTVAPRPLYAKDVLDAVEEWVGPGTFFIREIGGFMRNDSMRGGGRVDALLVPASVYSRSVVKQADESYWERPGLIGIEVKTSRVDLLKGLRAGQFTRYAQELMGLYVATPAGICKTAELPPAVGHLIVERAEEGGLSLSCRRQPEYGDCRPDLVMLWRIIFGLNKIMRQNLDYHKGRIERELKAKYREKLQRLAASKRPEATT